MNQIFLLVLCISGFQFIYSQDTNFQIVQEYLFDSDRQRSIPVQIYKPISEITPHAIIVINHGYGVKNTEYSYIAEPLCKDGYFVICIQHDLPGDPELARTGNLYEKRKPLWESGVQNIIFVLAELTNSKSGLNSNKIILIGHSNGGDISMLFSSLYPELVEKVISLDSLRMPFPTKDRIPILSLRATDTEADEGVLPEFGTTIIKLEEVKHIDMNDAGPEHVKRDVLFLIEQFIKEERDCNATDIVFAERTR